MNLQTVGDYVLAGNDFLAIAINKIDPQDAHWFTPSRNIFDDKDVTAWERAIIWAAPGL